MHYVSYAAYSMKFKFYFNGSIAMWKFLKSLLQDLVLKMKFEMIDEAGLNVCGRRATLVLLNTKADNPWFAEFRNTNC